ncbi:hypothetical protein BDQ17DRAFT_1211977, partial [Cyathus striatus]
PIEPPSTTIVDLLTITPQTENKALLLAALKETHIDNKNLQGRLVHAQASNLLNEMYCKKVQVELASKENKKKKKGLGKLMGDGLPRMLSGDEFYQKVVERTEQQQ